MSSAEHPLTILVVDDDATLVDVLGRVLKRDGHTVVQGNSVAEALEMADRHTPDLALIDLSLPDGDGVGLADRLREHHPDLPLILMTAYPIRVREDPAIASRFTRVMIKPLNLDELRQAVRESLRGELAAGASIPPLPAVAAASVGPVYHSPDAETDSRPAPQAALRSSDRWHWLKSGAMVAVALVVLAAFLVYIAGVPIPGLSAGAEPTSSPPSSAVAGVKLAEDRPHTIFVPEDVRKVLGIRKVKKGKDASGKEEVPYEDVGTAEKPTEMRPMILTGSTALDPDQILHVRARFAPAQVIHIATTKDQAKQHERPLYEIEHVVERELRDGDTVQVGDVLGVFYSDAVGSQKSALFDAQSQYTLDKATYDQALAAPSTTKVFLETCKRAVEGDVNHINQAKNTLLAWGIPPEDIDKIIQEAKASAGDDTKIAAEKQNLEDWGRVELKADKAGVIVERNIPEKELIQDPTVSLWQIAKVDKIQVIANASEDDLTTLLKMQQQSGRQLKWTIQTVNQPYPDRPYPIEDIGYLIDTNQHSAVVKGYIDNPGGKMRGAQLMTASIPLDPPGDAVEIDVSTVADDGSGHTYVFVQTDEKKSLYTLRRVMVTRRFDKVVYVKSRFPDAENLFKQLDTDKDGKVRLAEFLPVFSDRELELPAKLRTGRKTQEELFKKYATDKSDSIRLDQFTALWADVQKQVEQEDGERGLQPLEELHENDKVLKSGVLELKKELEDRESDAGK